MQFSNPAFIIPGNNNKISKKRGGGSYPNYCGSLEDFEDIKTKRISETESILKSASIPYNNIIDNVTDNIYFEISFHEKVKSKSSLPTKLLEGNHISMHGQTYNGNYLAVCSENNFKAFNNQIKKIELNTNKQGKQYSEESAYLSAISGISTLSQDEILHMQKEWKEKDRVLSYIHLSDSLSPSESSKILGNISNLDIESKAELLNLSSGLSVIYGNFASNFLDSISTPHPKNPIHKIEQGIIFKVSKKVDIPYKLEDIKIRDLEFDSEVAVFDSGIHNNDFLEPYVIDRVNYSSDKSHIDGIGHGTFVASRIVYGSDIKDQIFSNKELIPKNKVLDVKIFDNSGNVTDKVLLDALNGVVTKYPDIKIFNLSLNANDNTEIHRGSKNILTREIDKIAYKYRVIIIISAGNHNSYDTIKKYPDCLLVDEAVITPPADVINGLSVGSLVSQWSTKSIARNKEVSPFSRCGLDALYKKPDLVHFGGNIDIYGSFDGIGESGLSNEDNLHIAENVGTSFSAPLVTGIVGNIYSYLQKTLMVSNLIDMTRTLLLHSARYNIPLDSNIKESDKNKLVGFGIPDFGLAFDNSLHSVMYLYEGILKNYEDTGIDSENIHKIKFIVPEELKQPGKELKVRCTLTYMPDIAKGGDLDYALADIEMNHHYINSSGTLKSANLTQAHEDYRLSWNPIKYFEKRIRSNGYKDGDWEVWLTLNLRGDLDKSDYNQPYSLVISIEDITPDLSKRVEIGNIIRQKHPQYLSLQIKQKIQIK